MENHRLSNIIRYGIAVSVLLALCACADFQKLFSHSAKGHTATKSLSGAAREYVTDLAIANIVLENGGSVSDVADEVQSIQSFTQQKKPQTASVTIMVLEYADKGGKNRKSLAPLGEQGNFSAVSKVWAHLDASSYSLKDIRVLKASVSSGVPFKTKGKDDASIGQMLADRKQAVLANAHKISAVDDAQMQLSLLKFFMAAGHKDAAYICADNAKRLLPAVNAAGDKAAADQLARDLSSAESELRQKMPY